MPRSIWKGPFVDGYMLKKAENARAFGFLECVDNVLPVFGFAGEHMRWDLARAAIFFQNFQHLHKLAKDQNFFTLCDQWLEQVEERIGFTGGGVVAYECGVTANLAQSREGGEHLHSAFGDAFGLDGFHDRVAAAAEFGEVKFALILAEFAVVRDVRIRHEQAVAAHDGPAGRRRAPIERRELAHDRSVPDL